MRAAFIALCIVPTGGVLGWAAWQARPWRGAALASELSELLHVDVVLDDASHPAPGETKLTGLALSDPETGDLLARCELVHVTRDAAGTHIAADQVTIAPAATPILARWLDDRFRGAAGEPVHLSLGAIRLTAEPGEDPGHTLHDVEGEVTRASDGAQAWLRFAMAENTPLEVRPKIRVVRDRRTARPYTAVEVDATGQPLPCELAAGIWPAVATLGPESRFQGKMVVWPTPDGSAAEILGELTNVELERLFAGQLGRYVAGRASIQLEQAGVSGGRLVHATGLVRSGPGVIEKDFSQRIADWLGMGFIKATPVETSTAPVEFTELGFRFHLSTQGLQLEGACSIGAPLVVLTGPLARLELLGPQQPREVGRLAAIFSPTGSAVSLSPMTVIVASLLPLSPPESALR
jgi:hypothetical protein